MKELNFESQFISEKELKAKLEENTDVQVLNLSESSISTLSFLKDLSLTQLEELHLNNTKLSDLSNLSHLKNLKILYASELKLKDINFLSSLTNLRELCFEYSDIGELQPIENLVLLEKLTLTGNKKVVDLKPLTKLEHLKVLHLQGTGINSHKQLDPIRHMKFERISANETIESAANLLLRSEDLENSYRFF